MRRFIGLTAAAILLAASPATAQGPFMSLDVGLATTPGLTGPDVVSISSDGLETFHNPGDGARRGFRAGAAGGYAWERFRAEGEYFNRIAPETGSAHATFASVLYELRDRGIWRPYAGVGGGVQWVGGSDMVAYGFPDAATLPPATGAGEPDSDYIEDPTGAAASSTSALGVQFVGGIERVLRDSVRLGTRIRWAQFQRKAINEARFWSASVTLRYEF